jgi:DNA-binding response OmpR family regulator
MSCQAGETNNMNSELAHTNAHLHPATPRRVLVVEDNPDLSQLLTLHLQDACYAVDTANDGPSGLHKARNGSYDLLILDVMLPGLDGLEVCRQLRATASYIPILMLTSKSSELDRVLGLELGADDYVSKPFSILELLSRVKAILRRSDALRAAAQPARATPVPAPLTVGGLRIDFSGRRVTLNKRHIDLTAKEFDLLAHFAQQPGRVFTRMQLLDQVWGYGHDGYEHTVNTHINRLRAKIEDNPAQPHYVLTVWGVGYKFADRESV